MYQVFADNVCIFSDSSPDQAYKAVSPKLTLAANAAGSLSIILPKGNAGYDTVQRLTSTVRVERDGTVIWMGRVLSEKRDLWGSRELFCEGALAFLNDTTPMIANPTLASVLAAHNGKKVDSNRQITLGTSAYGGITAEADGSSSLEIVNKLVGDLGGVLRMRYTCDLSGQQWTPTLDWLSGYPTSEDAQTLEFGRNLLDFTRSWDMTDFSTYCYVRGAEIEESDPKAYYASGWITLGDGPTSPAAMYGRIEKYLDYSDLQSNDACISAAQTYLATQQFADMTLELTAVDLHILDPSIRPFELLEKVHVHSGVHGLDQNFAVTGMDIPLDAPENTSYTLALADMPYKRRVQTITKATKQVQQDAQTYADSVASDALSDANRETAKVKTTLEAADEQIIARVEDTEGNLSSLEITVEGIETRVENAEGAVSTVSQTANEIKAQVTDSQGNYTVANLKSDGFYVGNSQSKTVITGSMIRVDQLQGNIIYILDTGGNIVASMFASASDYTLGISAANVDFARDWDVVKIASPANLYFTSINMTLAQLLGI